MEICFPVELISRILRTRVKSLPVGKRFWDDEEIFTLILRSVFVWEQRGICIKLSVLTQGVKDQLLTFWVLDQFCTPFILKRKGQTNLLSSLAFHNPFFIFLPAI
jgi:hypothetical protein